MTRCRWLLFGGLLLMVGPLPAEEPGPSAVAALAARKLNCPEEQRQLWTCLHKLCQRHESSKAHNEDWLALTRPEGAPVRLTTDSPAKVKVLTGLTTQVPTFEARYQVWVVPAGGAAYLVAIPEDGLFGATNLMERVQNALTVLNSDGKALAQEKQTLATKILVGDHKEAWFVAIVRLYPTPGLPFGRGAVKVTLAGNQIKLTPTGARSLLIPMPDERQLGGWLGQPFAPPPNAAGNVPAGGKIYLALDWSRYLAGDTRREWLLHELQHVLRGVNPDALLEGSIYLHSGKTVAPWPLADIRQGKLAPETARLIKGHDRETLDTLAEVIAHANTHKAGISRLYFLTWNPSTTIDPALLDSQLKDVPRFSELPARCKDLPLRVVQVGENRLSCLASLGNRLYYTLPFGQGNEPSLTLPHWDE